MKIQIITDEYEQKIIRLIYLTAKLDNLNRKIEKEIEDD